MILAPLRGVTIRCFRECFSQELSAAGFSEAFTPFITAMRGYDPLKDRELKDSTSASGLGIRLTPQFIGKDPAALGECLVRIREAGFATADLNAGCPYPMVRNKGRGSGLLRTPDVLERMLAVGCEVMGEGRFSLKARLGIDRNDELLNLMPMINRYPLRFLTVHARNARQMYEGKCDVDAFRRIASVSKVPIVANGDIPLSSPPPAGVADVMVGRAFVRHLGEQDNSTELAMRYLAASRQELCGDVPVLGRMKELIAYWKDLPQWRNRWSVVKICRSVAELERVCLRIS